MIDALARLTAALAERYRIERELGQGGMATVYLAHDLKHDRHVALKVLKPELAAVLGAERFVVEIKTTASLQHPHILPLFDSGSADGFLFYVMPYVEGETLRTKLDRETQLSIDEAVKISTEVADALDYAHRHGVIHRDIKPENILLHDGRPMVADFGIALALSAAAGGRMTETGLSLGTPHYMSPEQATAEKELTSRSDIYSLGCVLYEMLTGNPPHTGATAQQIIMKILTEEAAPVTTLRKAVPPNVAAAAAKAVERIPADRFETARAFADALTNPMFTVATVGPDSGPGRRGTDWRARAALPLAVLAVLLLVAAAWGWLRPRGRESALGVFEIRMKGGGGNVAVSPDGHSITYTNAEENMMLRQRGALEAKVIPGVRSASSSIFSPGGDSIALVTGYPGSLMVASLQGGTPRVVVRDSAGAFGGAWGRDGTLYYIHAGGALMRVPAAGGSPKLVARPDSAQGHTNLGFPDLLPGEDAALVTVYSASPPQIGVVDLHTGTTRIIASGLMARFGSPDQVIVVRATGDLVALPFDARRRVATGPGVELGERMQVPTSNSSTSFALSKTGDLFYNIGGARYGTVVRVDRSGRAKPIDPDWQEIYSGLALSPDGTRLALSKYNAGRDELWLKALDRGPLTRLAFGGGLTYRPAWSPDGRSITFVSDRDPAHPEAIYRISAMGGGETEMVFRGPTSIDEVLWSADGRWLVYRAGSGGARDLFAVRWGSKDAPVPIAAGQFEERSPALSRDNRYIAYVSDESGRAEVYVRPFPDVASARWQVSTGGGTEPRWSHSGRELFYRSAAGDLIAAPVVPGPAFKVAEERPLFSTLDFQNDNMHSMYDVLPDDQGFLFVRQEGGSESRVVVIENWRKLLDQRRGR
jgi:serine/threonine-protein kinase